MGMNARRALPGHDLVGGEQRGADHVGRGFVDAAPGRRVAGVEKTLAGARTLPRPGRRTAACERTRNSSRVAARVSMMRTRLSSPRAENSAKKRRVAVRPERMAVAEAIARQALAGDHQNGRRRLADRQLLSPTNRGL